MDWYYMAEHNNRANSTVAGHELSDLSPRKIALFGAALAALVGAALLASYALFQFFYAGITRARPLPSPLSYSREPTPEPRLLVKPGDEWAAMRAQESRILNGYDWVDRDKGVVRIPIERAIEILAQRGLPVRTERSNGAAAEKQSPRRRRAEKRGNQASMSESRR
jgi:hypothetical protein